MIWTDQITDFERMYPTLEDYLERVDFYLQSKIGINHGTDYYWKDDFDCQITPDEAVQEYLYNHFNFTRFEAK